MLMHTRLLWLVGWIAIVSGAGVVSAACATNSDNSGAQGDDAAAPGQDSSSSQPGSDSGGGVGPGKGADTGSGTGTPPGPARSASMVTNGSAVAITPDGKIALAVNRTADSISLFQTDFSGTTPAVTKTIELNTLATAEPWSVVIGNDGDTAYAIYRRLQLAVKITNLHGQGAQPAITLTAKTGSEPTGIAISPSGTKLYVANWAEGTVTVVNTADMSVASTVDLNGSLAGTGFLGSGLTARPALAHPRAIVVTNGGTGNDSAETVYVTEFFSQPITGTLPTDDSQFDVGRQGVVYRFNAGTYAVGAPIPIAPVADTGFLDSDGNTTGCFPNQLYAAALNQGRLYVTSVCASPRGPVNVVAGTPVNTNNVKTEIHASVFVVDTAANAEVPAQGLRLTQQFQNVFNALADAGVTATNRFPLIPNDLAFKPGTNVAYVTGLGSDAVYRIAYNADGSLKQVGSTTQPFIDLEVPNLGQLPYGIAIEPAGNFALAINETQRNLSVLQFSSQTALSAVSSSTPPSAGTPAAQTNSGHRLFATGVARWSLNGASWNSCEGCHAEGLTDNVTWYFARGPRQTTSLDGTFGPNGEQRILNWTGIFDEIHDFELNARGNSGGVGAVVDVNGTPPKASDRIIFDGTAAVAPQVATQTRQDGLNGSTRAMMPENGGVTAAVSGTTVNSVLSNWDDIEAYVRQLRSPRAPTNLAAADVTAGAQLFAQNNCAGCHGTAAWTISKLFYAPGAANNGAGGALTTQTWVRPTPGNPSGTTGTFPPALAPGIPPFAFRTPVTFDPANDQIACVLRNVGTYATAVTGVVVKEVRANGANGAASMTVPAQGASGFNPPALIGAVTGAPYFHAGNARTLEEAFDGVFVSHHAAFSANFLANSDPTQIRQIVAYLLSIDDSTPPVDPPNAALGFDPILCNQFPGHL
jgi:YVTN family beta-propeller protein